MSKNTFFEIEKTRQFMCGPMFFVSKEIRLERRLSSNACENKIRSQYTDDSDIYFRLKHCSMPH